MTRRWEASAYTIVAVLVASGLAALAFTGQRQWVILGATATVLLLMHTAMARAFMLPVCGAAALACVFGNLHGSIVYLIGLPLVFGLLVSGARVNRGPTSDEGGRGLTWKGGRYALVICPLLIVHTTAASLVTGAPWVMALTLSLTIVICMMTYVLVGRTAADAVSRSLHGLGLVVAVPFLIFVGSRLSTVGAGSWTKIYTDSTWLNPNSLGVLFLLAASIPLSGLARRGFSWVRLASSAILVGACLATFSRSSTLGLTVMLVVIISRRKWLVVPFAAAVAYLVIRPPQALVDRLQYTVRGGQLDDSSSTRLGLWQSALQIAADHPFFGVGLPELGARLGPLASDTGIQFAHNTGMTVMAAFGLPLALGVAAATLRLLRNLRQQTQGGTKNPRDLAALAGIAGLVVASMFGEPILSIPVAFLATALAANSLRREGHP